MAEPKWAMTFASGKELSNKDLASIAKNMGVHSIGLLGQLENCNVWDYRVYVTDPKQITEKGIEYLRDRELFVRMSARDYHSIVNEVMPKAENELIRLQFGR